MEDGINLKKGYHLLEECYDQLAEVIRDNNADPRRITELVDESEQIIQLLASKIESSGIEVQEEVEILQAVKIKADAIVNLLREEMASIRELFINFQTGRQALNAYDLPQVGLGYTEGKFVDRKK